MQQTPVFRLFEVTFELGSKTLKDLLEYGGFDLKTLRETIKQAFASDLISDGESWIHALDGHKRFAHIYNEGIAKASIEDASLKGNAAPSQRSSRLERRVSDRRRSHRLWRAPVFSFLF